MTSQDELMLKQKMILQFLLLVFIFFLA